MTDADAWEKYPNHRKWFNKLYLASTLGYSCAPCGVAPEHTSKYIVRPIYNLSGMGVGASMIEIREGDPTRVQPGYFWCEVFEGEHLSVDYINKDGMWKPVSKFTGIKDHRINVFLKWCTYTGVVPDLPKVLTDLAEDDTLEKLNVEFIGDKVIEVHFRHSPDPKARCVIPIFKSNVCERFYYENLGWTFISDFDDADSFLEDPRIGFVTKGE